MVNQIYAYKLGQNQTYTDTGKRLPVTQLTLPQLKVISVSDSALILAIGQRRAPANKPLAGVLKAAGITYKPKAIRTIPLDAAIELAPGADLDLASVISVGDSVTATAISKGKGFSGVMKRHGFHGGPRTHGQSDRARAPGSISRGTTPGRVPKGKKMAGHMGNETVSIKNLKVVVLDLENKQITISGLIPGGRNALVKLTITKKSN